MLEPSTTAPRSHSSSLLVGLVLALSVGVYLVQAQLYALHPDDAFIILRYARNLADGQGPVFNSGERVDGCTGFLWMLLLAAARRLGFDLVEASRDGGIILGAAVIPLVYAAACRLAVTRSAALVGAAAVAALPAFAFWAGSGMETAPAAFLAALSLWLYCRAADGLALPAVLALAAMIRPDGLIVAGAFACERAVTLRGGRAFWRWCGVFLAVFAPYFVWRWLYYGDPLPNTFYAKVGAGVAQVGRGAEYLRYYLIDGGGAAMGVVAVAALLRRRDRRLFAIAGAVAAYWTYAVAVGGDYFALHRFLMPAVPLLALLVAVGLEVLPLCRPWAAALAMIALAAFAAGAWRDARVASRRAPAEWSLRLAMGAMPPGASFATPPPPNQLLLFNTRRVARFLSRQPPEVSVATTAIGEIGYGTNATIVDMLGLVDTHIAHRPGNAIGTGMPGHEKSDTDYVLSRRPEFIAMDGPLAAPVSPIPAMREMFASPAFQREYEWTGLLYRRRAVPGP